MVLCLDNPKVRNDEIILLASEEILYRGGLDAGISYFLAKPFVQADLLGKIQHRATAARGRTDLPNRVLGTNIEQRRAKMVRVSLPGSAKFFVNPAKPGFSMFGTACAG